MLVPCGVVVPNVLPLVHSGGDAGCMKGGLLPLLLSEIGCVNIGFDSPVHAY